MKFSRLGQGDYLHMIAKDGVSPSLGTCSNEYVAQMSDL